MQSLRFKAIDNLTSVSSQTPDPTTSSVTAVFGENVFTQRTAREYLSDEAYKSLIASIKTGKKIDRNDASQIAAGIRQWAQKKGATHYTHWFQPLTGITADQSKKIATAIGLTGASVDQAVDLFAKLYKCYMETDASLVEINPLNCDSKGNLIALDAKFNFDANALFRHPDLRAMFDPSEENASEMRAREFELLGRVATHVPFRSVTPHRDPARLADLCDAILADFAAGASTGAGPATHITSTR